MATESRKLLIFGVGKLAGPVLDVLAARYPRHRYVIVSRQIRRAELRANLTRYICTQWGTAPDLAVDEVDLLDTDGVAELLHRHQPDVILNATTPFPWWMIDALPESESRTAHSAGPGMWCALDCLLPLCLSDAVAQSGVGAVHVNACYPDMVNAFLANHSGRPAMGIGNLSNLVPGLKLTFAQQLGQTAAEIDVRLVAHHYTSLNAPTSGGSGGAPYHLSVRHRSGEIIFRGPQDDAPFRDLKAAYSRVRGVDGQGVTVQSAATVLATLLNGQRRRHHVPGPEGLPGGYPVVIDPEGVPVLDLHPSLTRAAAIDINCAAQRFDGVDFVRPGEVSPTPVAQEALKAITGFSCPPVTMENVRDVADEILSRLRSRHVIPVREL